MSRNRSVEILKDRPDLVDHMNNFRQKVENVLKFFFRFPTRKGGGKTVESWERGWKLKP